MPCIRGGFSSVLLPLLASFTMVRRLNVMVVMSVHIDEGGRIDDI